MFSERCETAAKLVSFEVQPARGAVKRNAEQQLKAITKYSDGSVRDVTAMALYESNDKAMAEVNDRGLVKILDITGNGAVSGAGVGLQRLGAARCAGRETSVVQELRG